MPICLLPQGLAHSRCLPSTAGSTRERQERPLPQLFLVADKQMSSVDVPPASPGPGRLLFAHWTNPQAEGRWGLRSSCKRYILISRRTNYCSEGSPRWCKFPARATTFGVNVTCSEKKPLPKEESSPGPPPSPLYFPSLEAVKALFLLGLLGESLAQPLSLQGGDPFRLSI